MRSIRVISTKLLSVTIFIQLTSMVLLETTFLSTPFLVEKTESITQKPSHLKPPICEKSEFVW